MAKPRLATLVPIRNMNRAVKFFTKKLGARLTERASGPMRNFWASIRLGGCDLWLVNPGKWEKRKLAYTTLVVGNIKRSVSGLQKKGVKFEKAEKMSPDTKISGPVATDQFGAAAFFKDSEGNLWMLWQNMM